MSANVSERPSPIEAARAFVDGHFPDSLVAFLTGSAARGAVTATSDLDIVVIAPVGEEPRWATFHEFGWPIELWVQTVASYPDRFKSDAKSRWPIMPLLCRDGVILRDRNGLAAQIQDAARLLLEQGPAPLTDEELSGYRYQLTWMLEDFEGCQDPSEVLLMATYLIHNAAGLLLALNGRWQARGKWLLRDLREWDAAQAQQLSDAFQSVGRTGEKAGLIGPIEGVLGLVGGRRFEGQQHRETIEGA